MKATCRKCNNTFQTYPSKIKQGRGLLCSNSCKWLENSERWRGNDDWEKTKSTQFKKGHKSLVEAKSKRYQGVLYSKWREKILKRDNFTCQSCGKNGNIVHHPLERKSYPELIIEPTNGITLCRSCHIIIHPPKK